MRRSEIDSTRDAGMPSRFFSAAWLVVVVLFSLPLVSACGGGSSGGNSGGSKWQGAARLIPENAGELGSEGIRVWDIAAIVAGDAPAAAMPGRLTEDFGPLLVAPNSIEDVNSFATEGAVWVGVSVMEGDFDFNSIRERLSEFGFEKQEGSETYNFGSLIIALLEGEGSVVTGGADRVKEVLDALDRGSGFLLDDDELRRVQYVDYKGVDADEYVGMTLNRASGGFFASVIGGTKMDSGGKGGWASGWSASAGSGSEVKLRLIHPFQQEKDAKANEDKVKAWHESALHEEVKLESVEVDGLFIIVTATTTWEAWEACCSYDDPYSFGQ